jgi:hypothetical protein
MFSFGKFLSNKQAKKILFTSVFIIFLIFSFSNSKMAFAETIKKSDSLEVLSQIPLAVDSARWEVCAKTADRDQAGTNSNISVNFSGVSLLLDDDRDNHERGAYECFGTPLEPPYKESLPAAINLSVSKFDDDSPDWYLEYIDVSRIYYNQGTEVNASNGRYPANRKILFEKLTLKKQ